MPGDADQVELIPAYYVSFQIGRIPTEVDHTRANPSPTRSNSAGFTYARQDARLTFAWDDGPPRADGRVPIYAQSVNVYFWLDDFAVSITSDYGADSCAYNATRRHEYEEHLRDPIRIFWTYRPRLIRQLNTIRVPTRDAPALLQPNAVVRFQERLEQQIFALVGATKRALVEHLKQENARADTRASYRLVYQQCSDEEWLRGP